MSPKASSRALVLHDVTYRDVWEALMILEPPIAEAAARRRTGRGSRADYRSGRQISLRRMKRRRAPRFMRRSSSAPSERPPTTAFS